jgi:hypothetical protein
MKTYYLDYVKDAPGNDAYGSTYSLAQNLRKETFAKSEIDEIIQWGYDDTSKERNLVDTEFYKQVKTWFDNKMNGYFAWKPFIIHDLLTNINDGDIVVYWDCIPKFPKFDASFGNFLEYVNENYEMIAGLQTRAIHTQYTKHDCFELMKCTDNKYFKRKQIQASWSIWKKTPKTMKILTEWVKWCKNENVVRCDLPNVTGNCKFEKKVEHRWDQSILTNLAVKYQCTIINARKSNWKLAGNRGKNLNRANRYNECVFEKLN